MYTWVKHFSIIYLLVMSRSKVLWVVCLGVLVLLSGIFVFKYNQKKEKARETKPTEQNYNLAEHFPYVPLEKDNEYHKIYLQNSNLYYYYEKYNESNLKIPRGDEIAQIDTQNDNNIKVFPGYGGFTLSLPNGFSKYWIGPNSDGYIIQLKSDHNVFVRITIYPGNGLKCYEDDYKNNNIFELAKLFSSTLDKSIVYKAIIQFKNSEIYGQTQYFERQGLLLMLNLKKKYTDVYQDGSPRTITAYPCVQIFPNPEDIELKKDHPEIYPEVIDIVKAIVESIRPINETK